MPTRLTRQDAAALDAGNELAPTRDAFALPADTLGGGLELRLVERAAIAATLDETAAVLLLTHVTPSRRSAR